MTVTADLVLFGLQAGLKLAQAARQAYVEDTAMRGIVLPLSQGLDSPLSETIRHINYIASKDAIRYENELRQLLIGLESPDLEEQQVSGGKLMDIFLKDLVEGNVSRFNTDSKKDNAARAGLLLVKQWREGEEKFPSALQRVGGAILEIAIDYFLHVPGHLDIETKEGKTVHTFLTALDSTDFQEEAVENIVVELFTTAVQTLSEHPGLFTKNENTQGIIGSVMKGVADESREQWKAIIAENGAGDFDADDRLFKFSKVVLRSGLIKTGEELLANDTVIDINNQGHRAVVESVGSSLLKMLLEDTGDNLDYSFSAAIKRTLSKGSLDKLSLTAIKAATAHPDVFEGIHEKPIRDWLHGILTEIYSGSQADGILFDDDLFSEIAFITIDQGINELPELLSTSKKPFLASIARSIFDAIAQEENGKVVWDFELTRSDVKQLFSATLGSIASNPQWFSGDDGHQALIATTTALLVDSLGKAEGNLLRKVIRSEKLVDVIQAVLNSELKNKLDASTSETLSLFVTTAIQSVASEGKAGLKKLIQDGYLEDLLSALAEDEVFAVVTGDNAEDVSKILEGINIVLKRMRSGEFIPLPELQEILKDHLNDN